MRNIINYKKSFAVFFTLSIVGMCLMLLFFVDSMDDYRSAKLSDFINDTVREEMDRQNRQAAALALAIAGNETLAAAMKDGDRNKASQSIDRVASLFESYGVLLQLHTPDLKVFMRSWDRGEYGESLDGFRKGLVYVRKTKMPFSSIELGKKLNFKAIAPVKLKGKYVGSIEVIKSFDEVVKNFAHKKISLLILMDSKFLNVAEQMADYPRLGNFVICHKGYDKQLFTELQEDDLHYFIGLKKSFTKNYFISIEPMRDLSGERLGFFVSAIPKKAAKAMTESDDDMSFLLRTSKDDLVSAYKSKSIEAQDNAGDIKRLAENDEKRNRLKNMSREELENMLLNDNKNDIKRGEIR